MIGWPTSWQQSVLRAAGLPVTQWGLDVLSAWNKSTPVVPATYNPLGMPAKGTSNVAYLNTPYGLFSGITAFGKAFSAFLTTPKGRELAGVLSAGDSLSDAYRAIHALGWPGNATETDYPSALLDMLEEAYRAKLATKPASQRKTVGSSKATPAAHAAIRMQSALIHTAATQFADGAKAVQYIVRGMG